MLQLHPCNAMFCKMPSLRISALDVLMCATGLHVIEGTCRMSV